MNSDDPTIQTGTQQAAEAVNSIVQTLPSKEQRIIRAIEFDVQKALIALSASGGVAATVGVLNNDPKVWVPTAVQATIAFLTALLGRKSS